MNRESIGVEIMAYGLDLKQRVIVIIENASRIAKVVQVFGIGKG
ncbi:MAG: hypothetical protein J7F05_19445 [Trichodesmium erythraeum GBRTRLIN201]|nr:hypothetical protein [Trichodesmium erythraeum GBRTRLIN201]